MARTVQIATSDGHTADAFAAGGSTTKRGGFVVVHEIEGLTPHFGDLCDRLAAAGYAAVAPDLFGRAPTIPELLAAGDIVGALNAAFALGPDRWLADLDDARRALAAEVGVDGAHVAVTGFCFGGYVTLLAATEPTASWAGAVPFYGPPAGYGGLGAPSDPRPLDRADRLWCPTLMLYGSADPFIPVDDVHAFADKATAAGAEVDVVVEAAGHAFFNDTRDTYDVTAATNAWHSLLAFSARLWSP